MAKRHKSYRELGVSPLEACIADKFFKEYYPAVKNRLRPEQWVIRRKGFEHLREILNESADCNR